MKTLARFIFSISTIVIIAVNLEKIQTATLVPEITGREKPFELTQEFLDKIKEFEGFHSEPYICPGGKLTIGYGFTEKKYLKMAPMSRETADKILIEVLSKAAKDVDTYVKVPLMDYQKEALISFDYNCGCGNLNRLVSGKGRLNSGNYDSVSRLILLYNKSKGKKLAGLVKRRKWESECFKPQLAKIN